MKKKTLVHSIVLRDIDFEYHDVPALHSKKSLCRLPKHVLERMYEHQVYKDNYIIQPNLSNPSVVTLRSCRVFPDNVKFNIYTQYKKLYESTHLKITHEY